MKPPILLLIVALLMSCACSSRPVADSMTLYSPPFLKVPAGTVIQTAQGRYQSQTDEVWHSDAEYQQRVREALTP
jgi:hypothetical protein